MRPRKEQNELIIGGKQLTVLRAVFRLKEEAFGGGIYVLLAKGGEKTALPQIYSILDKLKSKGLVEFEFSLPRNVQGGRRRKVYKITGKGQKVLNASNIENVKQTPDGGFIIPGLARLFAK